MTSQVSEDTDPQEQGSEQTRVILVAITSNFWVAVFKFIVAATSGSSAMISEGIHSLVDTGNELLLLQGLKAPHKSADESHPFGYDQELYFWTLVVAFGIFTVGGGVSLAQIVGDIRDLTLHDPAVKTVLRILTMHLGSCCKS